MNLKTSESLTEAQVQRGLNLVIKDGLTAEAMTTFTSGTFLMAMALQFGATNFQIGLLAALPTFTNIFQIFSIWLVQRYNNRRAIMVVCCLLSRTPLLVVGLLPFLFSAGTSIQVLIFLLSLEYLFGSIAGASWHSWMKDLVPQHLMGSYFSRRNRMMQTLNVVLSLSLALLMDFIKSSYPQYELTAYGLFFFAGGAIGLAGVYLLSRTPEPTSYLAKENIFKLLVKPLRNTNFRRLLLFQSAWSAALNMATPFFSVYMLKGIGLPLSYIIGLNVLGQVSSIFSMQFWGRCTDRYSNKTVISIAAPLYVLCILAWTFTALPASPVAALTLLAGIHMASGVCTAGINLAFSNIGLKLAPKQETIVYISARNIAVASLSALGPLLGGCLADWFATLGPLQVAAQPPFQAWNFVFLTGGLLTLLCLPLLRSVAETGEVEKAVAVTNLKQAFKKQSRKTVLSLYCAPLTYTTAARKTVAHAIGQQVGAMRRLSASLVAKKHV